MTSAAIKATVLQMPTKSMRSHVKDHLILAMAVSRAVKKEGGRILGDVGEASHHRQNSTRASTMLPGFLNNLKSARAEHIFSDEKTWTVDLVRDRCSNCFMAFGGPEGAKCRHHHEASSICDEPRLRGLGMGRKCH